jgi:hypothetical protein
MCPRSTARPRPDSRADLPGFGGAPALRDRTPTAAASTDAVEAALDRAGLHASASAPVT